MSKTNTSSRSSNIFLFWGEDDFSIKRKVNFWKQEFAKKYPQSSALLLDGEAIAPAELSKKLEEALTPSLFSEKKLIICRNCFPTKASDQDLAESIIKIISALPPDYFLVFEQTKKPDRRLASIKKILSQPMEIVCFSLPHGRKLDAWIAQELKMNDARIEGEALELLAKYLGRDLFEEKKAGGKVIEVKEAFNLWQVHNELEKLISRTTEIKTEDVQALIKPKVPENIFALSDQIIAGNKKQALQTMEYLLVAGSSDEKSETIRIVGLLAEQFRSLVTVSSFSKHQNQQEIASLLGWSPGRVFINLKLANNISFEKLKQYLGRLLTIDQKLKSSDTNPKLLLSMFIQES
ncbi:MAG: hypothetical protein HY395_01940 [Candidatus Doudnabacteria bacterium]|nr:hypothetical protein [Candidatus Doudnabacteria bacterium]